MDEEAFKNTAIELFIPVMEAATVMAAHYAGACGRNTVQAEDMSMGLMYAARNIVGKQIGSIYPEIYENESDTESTESDVSEDEWFRYTNGDDEMACKMNECADTWDSWNPENPVERALKNAVDKNSVFCRDT